MVRVESCTLGAISEAMNQMMGSSATSLSSMLNRTIDISPPIAEVVDLKNTLNEGEIDSFLSEEFMEYFHMEIGDLVDSEIMQLYPPAFVKEMCKGVSQNMGLIHKKCDRGCSSKFKHRHTGCAYAPTATG